MLVAFATQVAILKFIAMVRQFHDGMLARVLNDGEFLAHLSTNPHGELLWSVNVRCLSGVVRRAASTMTLKAYSSYTPGPVDTW